MKKLLLIVLMGIMVLNVTVFGVMELNGLDDGWHTKIENQSNDLIQVSKTKINPLGLDDGWHS